MGKCEKCFRQIIIINLLLAGMMIQAKPVYSMIVIFVNYCQAAVLHLNTGIWSVQKSQDTAITIMWN